MWGCPGGHDCSDHVLLQPRVQATPPHSLGVSRSRGGRRRTGTAVPQLLGPVTAAGRRFTGSPSPSALQEAQAEELAPVLRPQPLCCPQGSPETAGLPARDPGQDGAGSASGASVQPLPDLSTQNTGPQVLGLSQSPRNLPELPALHPHSFHCHLGKQDSQLLLPPII